MTDGMNTSLRLRNDHSLRDTIMVLGDMNPKAAAILLEMFHDGEENGGALGSLLTLTVVRHLDALGIYGDDIVTLHERVGRGDVTLTKAVLDASHSKLITPDQVRAAIAGTEPLDAKALKARVHEHTRGFNSATYAPL